MCVCVCVSVTVSAHRQEEEEARERARARERESISGCGRIPASPPLCFPLAPDRFLHVNQFLQLGTQLSSVREIALSFP